jgi:hypothetical protein
MLRSLSDATDRLPGQFLTGKSGKVTVSGAIATMPAHVATHVVCIAGS